MSQIFPQTLNVNTDDKYRPYFAFIEVVILISNPDLEKGTDEIPADAMVMTLTEDVFQKNEIRPPYYWDYLDA